MTTDIHDATGRSTSFGADTYCSIDPRPRRLGAVSKARQAGRGYSSSGKPSDIVACPPASHVSPWIAAKNHQLDESFSFRPCITPTPFAYHKRSAFAKVPPAFHAFDRV